MPPQQLIFDADDTLWENNIYFEEAFDEFCAYLNHSRLTPDEVRAVLDEIEIVNNRIHGYGSVTFGRNLKSRYCTPAGWQSAPLMEHDARARGRQSRMRFCRERWNCCPAWKTRCRFWRRSIN